MPAAPLPVPHLVSLEALSVGEGAGRRRPGHTLPRASAEGLAVSDAILFAWDEEVEETLEAVVPHMLGSPGIDEGTCVGVFWEIYGVRPDGRSRWPWVPCPNPRVCSAASDAGCD